MTYEERLRAIGRLVNRQNLRDICVMETTEGAVVSGIAPLDRRTGIVAFAPRSIQLDNEAIQKAHNQLTGRRDGQSRGWFK